MSDLITKEIEKIIIEWYEEGKLTSIAKKYVNKNDIEDAVHTGLVKMLRSKKSLRPYLMTTFINSLKDFIRKEENYKKYQKKLIDTANRIIKI